MARGYLTPGSIPAATIERRICIPNEPYILAAVNGALMELTYPHNWELYGAITKEQITAELLERVLAFQASEGNCMHLKAEPAILFQAENQNVGGGTATSGSWQKRTLNQLTDLEGYGVTLVSSEFTLPAGRWHIKWTAPAHGVGRYQSRLFSVTEGTVTAYGTSCAGNASSITTMLSVGWAIQNNVSATKYRIESQVQSTLANNGYGIPANFGPERYTIVECYPLT